jgi:hypothetical protein
MLTAEERSLRARKAAYARHARTTGTAATAHARAGFRGRFLAEVDAAAPGLPEVERQRRADLLVKAHMLGLATKSARSRREMSAIKKRPPGRHPDGL